MSKSKSSVKVFKDKAELQKAADQFSKALDSKLTMTRINKLEYRDTDKIQIWSVTFYFELKYQIDPYLNDNSMAYPNKKYQSDVVATAKKIFENYDIGWNNTRTAFWIMGTITH